LVQFLQAGQETRYLNPPINKTILLLFSNFISENQEFAITIRNDKGCRNIAKLTLEYLIKLKVNLRFKHLSPLKENVYIEAFQSNPARN
jgi:hypothetical protein